jgi:hypothetical protein
MTSVTPNMVGAGMTAWGECQSGDPRDVVRAIYLAMRAASAMSASGQDRETGLEAKPASAVGKAETLDGLW